MIILRAEQRHGHIKESNPGRKIKAHLFLKNLPELPPGFRYEFDQKTSTLMVIKSTGQSP